ncbi:hypothetical protein GQ44DRAFT_313658 [Phaeosphaeriaceae sp. PMI808]|nr:hypothetical protein GQ44DRAFT_313658 [Phaeosphaeriaceae sp. PMI808]
MKQHSPKCFSIIMGLSYMSALVCNARKFYLIVISVSWPVILIQSLMLVLSSSVSHSTATYDEVMNKEASRLFEPQRIEIEVLYTRLQTSTSDIKKPENPESDQANEICTSQVRTLDQLNTHLQQEISTKGSVIYLIPQRFSWGRLQITSEAFESVRMKNYIFPRIVHMLREFGSKTCDNLPQHCSFQGGRFTKHSHIYKLCYINRFVERNGRGRGDPWSIRQTGVYQKIYFDTGYSSCVVLQISKFTRKQLDLVTAEQALGHFDQGDQIMELHRLILLSTADNWGGYIDHLHSIVKDMNEKACFSYSGNTLTHSCLITFADVQTLQKLKTKILRVSVVLGSCLELADRLVTFCSQLQTQGFLPNANDILISVELYAADIKNYQRNIDMILQALEGTVDVITKILSLQNSGALRAFNNGTARNLGLLKDTVTEIAKESKRTNSIAAETQKDSMSLKALSTVATIFLPPTLLATICSSNLVEPKHSVSGEDDHLVVTRQFWIYVLLSFGAIVLTWLSISATKRWWVRSKGHEIV